MTLKKTEIQRFKQILLDLRRKLTQTLKGSSEEIKHIEEGMGYSQHQADQGTDNFDRTISLELTNREYSTLKQIERALEKIEEDSYGKCDITGEEIPIARLQAVPWATMTVKAQEMLEKGLL